jgi:DNA-binding transcriptional regulator YhcF (GntR family)
VPIHTIEPRRLYRQIADQLSALIEAGEYAVGSRPSVREALIALEVEGLIEVRIGSGIYVRPDDPQARRVSAEGPLETIRARQLIESELAAHAARHMKKAQIAELREAIDIMVDEVAKKNAGRPAVTACSISALPPRRTIRACSGWSANSGMSAAIRSSPSSATASRPRRAGPSRSPNTAPSSMRSQAAPPRRRARQ